MSFTIKQLANITVVQKATSCSLKEAKQFVSKSKVNLTEASVKEIKKLFLEAKELKWTTNINVKDSDLLGELFFFVNDKTNELWIEKGEESIDKIANELRDEPDSFVGKLNDFYYFTTNLEANPDTKSYILNPEKDVFINTLHGDKPFAKLSSNHGSYRVIVDEVLADDYHLQTVYEKTNRKLDDTDHDRIDESVTPVQNAKYSLQKGKTSQDEKFNNHFIVVDPDPTIYGVIGKAHMGDDAKYVFISKHPATKKYDRMEFQDFNDASGYAKKVIATLGGTVKLD